MRITVNGTARDAAEGMTLAGLLADLGVENNGVAVAVNARVVRGATFAERALEDGDVVEIIRAVAGG